MNVRLGFILTPSRPAVKPFDVNGGVELDIGGMLGYYVIITT